MPRERRIEYADAFYHVLARGDRKESIVQDGSDRQRFEETLREIVERSGWRLLAWAWVLMSNHYHFLIQTPEPNLVRGMTWFQNTWTRRFNARHRLWGHLFGGRYKAIPVEEGDYLVRLIQYIHLNPVRAGLVKRGEGLESYPWSSLADYIKPRRKRRPWVAVEEAMAALQFTDTARGRRQYLRSTEQSVDWNRPRQAGNAASEGRSLQSTLRRDWYFGSEALLERLGRDQGELKEKRRRGYTGAQARDHGESEAGRIIQEAGQVLGIESGDWVAMRKGDWRKGLVAGIIRERALVDNGWLAERLQMGARNAVSRTIRQAREHLHSHRKDRQLAKQVEQNVKTF